jgi:pyrophosphatase PpaX
VRYETVLFDLDGTLIDSGAMILASFKHAAQDVLGLDVPDEQILAAVGGPGLLEQMRTLDATRVDDLVASYRAHNEPLHANLQACRGMLRLLGELDEEARTLGIVTAKRRATVDLAFAVLPLERYFDVVVTSDETERLKPHPDPILRAVELAEADPARTAYVGDSPFDVQAAKAAGVGAIAVTWGNIHSAEVLRAEEPDAVVDDPEELYGVL